MKWVQKNRGVIVEVITFLFILLFVYAAVSKLLDYENFRVQLGQSPMLTAFSGWVAWIIPTLELLVVYFLFLPRYRLAALYFCFFLMTVFTFYILVILNFSPFVPCSCGGILESMGWTTHLIFNIVFILLALTGALVHNSTRKIKIPFLNKPGFLTSGLVLCAAIIVIGLYGLSETMIYSRNKFIRIFPPHPIMEKASIPLKYNSYYIAGETENEIYLGNATAPLHMIVIDSTCKDARELTLSIKDIEKYKLTSAHVKVLDSMIYLVDGDVPVIFKGNVQTMNLYPFISGKAYFDMAEPAFQGDFVIRSIQSITRENTLGLLNGSTQGVQFYPGILQKQVDGVFCTDGSMHYDKQQKKLIYIYYYRNEYLVIDSTMSISFKGHTIDTNAVAKIGTTILKETGIRQMTAPPVTVNKSFYSYGHHLFVHSALLAKNEDKREFLNASVIDVYNLDKISYRFSFYIPNYKNSKLREFMITRNKVIALYERDLVVYDLGQRYFRD